MQGTTKPREPKIDLKAKERSLEDKRKLVNAFMWLIKEDKKQNPELYQLKKITTK